MILREEYNEADMGVTVWSMGLAVSLLALTMFCADAVDRDGSSRGLLVFAAAVVAAVVTCAVNLVRCRRIVRAWRDAERAEAILAEAERES
jgi:hypothetical protein